jgi:hypothetical protein
MKRIITLAILLLSFAYGIAQSPQKMSFQAVVRNNTNTLLSNQPVGLKMSILQGSATGTVVYSESQTATTNTNGLVSIQIGSGSVLSGNFSTIDWSNGPYFIQTETDVNGGTNYTLTSTTQLLSVPYALYAQTSGSSIPGPQGPIGLTGPAGANGADGATGAQGPAGTNGTNGTDGLSAYQIWINAGNTGTQADFLASLQGAQGIAGTNGADGATGLQGPAGANGADGATGAQGPAGTNGTNGADGLSAYQIWLNAGNTGTQADFLASLQGAQGIAGTIGADGATGPQGPAGANGIDGATGSQGPAGTNGTNGADGLSAYQIWLNAGNTGTQTQFLASLQGATGAQGPNGLTGATGPQGLAGSNASIITGAISTTSSANGATITSGVLSLTPADATNGGVVTNGTQTIAGTKTFTNAVTGNNTATSTIAGFAANINAQTVTNYTLTAADNGKIITFSNACTVRVPSTLFAGFNCFLLQAGTGQVTIVGNSGVTVNNRTAFTKTAGQYAIATVLGLNNTTFISSGDMSN